MRYYVVLSINWKKLSNPLSQKRVVRKLLPGSYQAPRIDYNWPIELAPWILRFLVPDSPGVETGNAVN